MNRAEFEKLSIEHLDACYRLALQLTKHPDDARDLVQESYLRALRNVTRRADDARPAEGSPATDNGEGAFKGFTETGGGIRSWLFTIIHNTFYTRAQRKARGPTLSPDLEVFGPVSNEPSPDQPPPAWDLASLDWEQVDGRVRSAFNELSDEHRQVILLWGVEGKKYREIASMLGVPIGTVMSRLHRARASLAKSLEDFRQEQGWKGGEKDPAN